MILYTQMKSKPDHVGNRTYVRVLWRNDTMWQEALKVKVEERKYKSFKTKHTVARNEKLECCLLQRGNEISATFNLFPYRDGINVTHICTKYKP